MNDALVISAANLDIIERNLGAVAEELTGVISNVNNVNQEMSQVNQKVEDLNSEVKNLVKDIQKTTIITNARQSIMYNNEQINKKYGYYDVVRRNALAVINAVGNSNISKKSLINLRESVILNNPNYWLSSALATVISWLIDDKANYEKELKNSLSVDDKKSSLFFCMINLKFNRIDTSKLWLKRYLSKEDPSNLDKDFITVLDMVSTGIFGDDSKEFVLNKITTWFNKIKVNSNIMENNVKRFEQYILTKEDNDISMPLIENYSISSDLLKENIAITSSYNNIYMDLNDIIAKRHGNKNIDDVIYSLIHDYEGNELVYQQDNLRNNLLISCNGDTILAEKLFEEQKIIYDDNIDLINLFTNIVLYNKEFHIGVETQKLALCFIKDNLKIALTNYQNKIYKDEITIQVDNFKTKTKDGQNVSDIKGEIKNYINNIYKDDSKDLIAFLAIINIIGIIGMFVTITKTLFVLLILIILLVGNGVLLYKLYKKIEERDNLRRTNANILFSVVEKVLAEIVDYNTLFAMNNKCFDDLNVFLDNLNVKDYLKANKERNIVVGD